MTTIRKSLANYQIPTIRGTLESLLIWPTAKWWRRCKAYISTDILLIALTFGLWFLVVCKKIKRPGLSYFSSWALAKNLVKNHWTIEWQYRKIHDHRGLYRIHTRPCRTKQGHCWQYKSIQNRTELHKTIQVRTRPYKSRKDHANPYKTRHDQTWQNKTVQESCNRTGQYNSGQK